MMLSRIHNLRRRLSRFRSNDRGVITVELAIVMPLFLFLTLGAFELANYQTLEGEVHHVVRTVGRSLSVGDIQAGDAAAAVSASLADWGGTPTTTVTETAGDITLRVSVPISGMSLFSFLDSLQAISAEASLTFYKE